MWEDKTRKGGRSVGRLGSQFPGKYRKSLRKGLLGRDLKALRKQIMRIYGKECPKRREQGAHRT